MDIHHQLPNEVVATTAMGGENPFAVRGNTRTVRIWHTQNGPLERKAEAERQAALEHAETEKEKARQDKLKALYSVSNASWEKSERRWRSWINERKAENYIDLPHSLTPTHQSEQDKVVGEARFSKIVPAQHHNCILCETMNSTWADARLSRENKEHRIRRLAHRDPMLRLPSPFGKPISPGARGESSFEELVSASAWGQGAARPAQNSTAHPTYDPTSGWRQGFKNPQEFLRATEELLERTGGSKEVSEALANARELDHDLAELEKSQKSLKARIEFARKGYSVIRFNDRMCKDRRDFYPTMTFQRLAYGGPDLGVRERVGVDREGKIVEKEAKEEEEGGERLFVERMQPERQQRRDSRDVPSPAGEGMTVWNGSPAPYTLTVSPEPQNGGPSMYFKAMQEFSRHTREREDNASASTDDDPFRYDTVREMASTIHEAAGPSNEVAAASSPKGKAKKDSKVERLLEEDGVSFRDFALKPKQNKSSGLRKLSVKAGSSSRPRWMP